MILHVKLPVNVNHLFLQSDLVGVMSYIRWFRAEDHMVELKHFVDVQMGVLVRALHCVDCFGASGRIRQTWEKAGFSALGFDIKLSQGHDLCSESGLKTLLTMGLQKLGFNLIQLVPGCSWFHICPSCFNSSQDSLSSGCRTLASWFAHLLVACLGLRALRCTKGRKPTPKVMKAGLRFA